jgi:hypothetical protein
MKSGAAFLVGTLALAGCQCSPPEPSGEQPSGQTQRGPETPGRRIGVHMSPDMARRLALQKPVGALPATPSLDNYVGFSNDGLVFAYVLPSSAGGGVLHFVSATTNTEEKTVPLDSLAHRQEASAALTEAGLPPPGAAVDKPKPLGADVKDGRVVLTFGGAPASKTYEPFGGGAKIDKAEVVATSKDGKYAAVRIEGTPAKGQGSAVEFHVFPLFG